MRKDKLFQRILASPENVRFGDMVTLVEAFGFTRSRVRGSHHVFRHPGVPYLVNLQSYKGKAKPYQIRQFLTTIEEFNLTLGDEE